MADRRWDGVSWRLRDRLKDPDGNILSLINR